MERTDGVTQLNKDKQARRISGYNLALPFSERRALLMIGDILISALAGFVAFWGWHKFYPHFAIQLWGVQTQVKWLAALGLAWLILVGVNEGYDLRVAVRASRVLRLLVTSVLELAFFYLVLFFIWGRASWMTLTSSSRFSTLPRITPALFMLLVTILTLLWRLAYRRMFTSAALRRRAIIVGGGKAGLTLVSEIKQAAPYYEIIGFVDDDPEKQGHSVAGLPVLGDRHDLVSLAQETFLNEVILAITHEIHTDLFQVLMDCHELGIEIRPMPAVYEELLGRVPVEHLGQKWFLAPFWNSSRMPTLYRIAKRSIDIALALMGLTVLSAFLPFIFLANRLSGPGPLFYSQDRVGHGGKLFRMYKLRSMIPDAEAKGEAVWASENDPRVTRTGRFLRKTRLDELPQLFNVLKGEMSIVGPRPERPEFVQQLHEQIPFYRTRHSVKPGLTGWAQIKYRYGNTVEDALVKLQYDLYYVKRQSLLLDVLIMLRTIKVMLTFRGT